MKHAHPPSRREGGFALIIVLWALVLISFIIAHVVATGRTEIRIASNLMGNAAAAAAADGAIYQAVFNLLDPQPKQRWPLDGRVNELMIGGCQVGVRVTDDAGRINPNVAAPALIESLLRVTGSDASNARRLAEAIAEWVGQPGFARARDALVTEYRAAGLGYAAPGERMESLAELQRVLYMTPAVYEAIRPHLSLFAPPQPDPARADPIVAAALAALAPIGAAPAAAAPESSPITAVITATAQGRSNAVAVRTAVVRIVPSQGKFTLLSWENANR